ncbi:MAG: 50S ribosomal protein L13 [Minisyncoccales bacterium]|jgi:large subunit ribosomal protein L13
MKTTSIKREKRTIDATGMVLGKLAVIVAVFLRGKDKPGFAKNVDAGDFVTVKNFRKVMITGKKLEQEKDYRYSGYMSGLKATTMGETMEKNPGQLLRQAVYRMLPTNKLRDQMIKRLTVQQ